MLLQKIASWPFVSPVASRIGSRYTGHIIEQYSSEHEGRLSSIEQEGEFSEFEGTFSISELRGKFFFKPFFLRINLCTIHWLHSGS